MTSPKAVNMISKIAAVLLLASSFAVAKDKEMVSVEVKESVSVTMTHHSAVSTLFNDQKSERQVQSFDLKAVINGEHVMLGCQQLSKAFAVETACQSLTPGTYSAELRGKGRFVTLTFSQPITGKEVKQNYSVQGSW